MIASSRPDIDRAAADHTGRAMVLAGWVEGVEHVPVREHELAEEHAVVRHRGDVNRVRRGVPREEVI
jgi:hypothetical protein